MLNLMPIIISGFLMIVVGVLGIIFTDEIYEFVIKIIGEKKNSFAIVNPTLTIWSMRIAGAGAIFMGFIMLWVCWRNLP